jgi:hypothetical protein
LESLQISSAVPFTAILHDGHTCADLSPRAATRRYRDVIAAGVLFALTLPGPVLVLVVVATAEHAWSRPGRRSPQYGRIDLAWASPT